MRPSVYIETSIVSYLVARPSRDPLMAERQRQTREWWEDQRAKFDLFTSEMTISEIGRGEAAMARARVAALKSIPVLLLSSAVDTLSAVLIARGPLPSRAEADAYHISVAAVYGVRYLLTWNSKHIANPRMRPKVEVICREYGFEPPILCTPDTFPRRL
jgi:predicted nucleic acid-binding protein